MTEDNDQARTRWIVMQMMRLSGAALVMLGAVVAVGRTSLPPAAGTVLMLAGLLDATVIPLLLARRWRTPKP